jgi:hypothetical protein
VAYLALGYLEDAIKDLEVIVNSVPSNDDAARHLKEAKAELR